MSRHRAEPDVIDLTEEPDSPVLQSNAAPFRSAARSAARSARPSAAPRQSSTVIDLTGDDDNSGAGGASGGDRHANNMMHHHGLVMFGVHNDLHSQINRGSMASGPSSAVGRAASVLSAFSFGNLAHLTQLAIGAARGDNGSSGHDSSPRRNRSAHRQTRTSARTHNHRMQQNQHQQRRAAAAAVAFGDFDLFGNNANDNGFNPLGDNLPNFNYRLNGGLFQPVFPNSDVPPWHNIHSDPHASAANAYQAPAEALPGYTRSTGEDLVAICASCDRELEYDPDADEATTGEPPAKRTRKPRDRAQHHFWAVRTCGHVYCQACYENRRNGIKKDGTSAGSGRGNSGSSTVMFVVDGKTIYCAVEGCESDVTAKKQWQGLYV
ncbi:hypothetical protein SEUCBS139899_008135 [Sporothrix eucalyptigena]|uniref:Cell cycle control protein n=1 Tax=Sporothrix eucalyptigena TaxID=1812306 RepID=A0ABP0D484_9PEZI